MKIVALVEKVAENHYRASNRAFQFCEEGETREEAIHNFHLRATQSTKESELVEFELFDSHPVGSLVGVSLRELQADEVLFLIPSNLTRPFFASLLHHCEVRIEQEFHEDLRTILRYVPRDDLNTDELIRLLKREFRLSQKIRLIVAIPTGSIDLSRKIAEVLKEVNKPLSVIALTLPFHSGGVFRKHDLQRPPFVLCNSKRGTEMLGKDASERVPPNVKNIKVAFIRGTRGRIDSKARVDGFLLGLKNSNRRFEDVTVDCKLYCDWMREKARDAFAKLVQEQSDPIHIVFAANDEMALGVRDAIIKTIPEVHRNKTSSCIIYGFDAIPEVMNHIEHGDKYIKGTIEQPLDEIAKKLVGLMKIRIHHENIDNTNEPKTEGILVEPIMHVSQPLDFPQISPPPYEKSSNWKTTDSVPVEFGAKGTLTRYANRKDLRQTDEHGIYAIHGKYKIRKYRVVDGIVYWWVGDNEEKDSG